MSINPQVHPDPWECGADCCERGIHLTDPIPAIPMKAKATS